MVCDSLGEFHDLCRLAGRFFYFYNRYRPQIHASRCCVPRFFCLATHSHQSFSRPTRAHGLDRVELSGFDTAKMDEARAVVADFCEKNPYLLGALPMTWFGCGPFARIWPFWRFVRRPSTEHLRIQLLLCAPLRGHTVLV